MKKCLIFLILFVLCIDVVYADGCDALLSYTTATKISDMLRAARIGIPVLLIIVGSNDLRIHYTAPSEKVSNEAYKRFLKKLVIAGAFFLLAIILRLLISIDSNNNALNLVASQSCESKERSGKN